MLVRRIQRRGANIVVEAHAEVLFTPGAEIPRFTNRLTARMKKFTAEAAPTNKRPRWGHYGKPLKTTFTASSTTRRTRGGGRAYGAVGSGASHAYYVDQGTGVFAGSAPYPAKVLPPWQRGSASLYEATWRPAPMNVDGVWVPGPTVAPVMIKGQKGQFFFDAGLKRGFQSMRLRSYQLPAEGISGISKAIATFPTGLANFQGNTPADAGFVASLTEWRAWRDAAWKRGEELGKMHRPGRTRVAARAEREQAARATQAKIDALRKSREAANRRARKQAADLAAQKKRREEGAAKRKEAQRLKNLADANLKATFAANKLRANGFKNIRIVEARSLTGVVIGYTLYYSTAKGETRNKTFR